MPPDLRTVRRSSLHLVLLAVAASATSALIGCGRTDEAASRSEPRPAPGSPDSIPAGPVTGSIAGKPFVLKGARYSLDIRPGHEKADIVLTDVETKDACADLGPSRATSVWLRWTGIGVPPPGAARVAPNEAGPWEAHYERFDKGWRGNGHAAALIALRDPKVDRKLEGDVSVCFGDGADSCVAGSFVARYCPIRIDAPVRGVSALEPLPDAGVAPPEPKGGSAPAPSGSATPGENPPPG